MTEEKQPPAVEPVAKTEPAKVRVFVYDNSEISDPDTKMSPDDVREFYVTFYPELANAEVLKPVLRPSKTVPGTQEEVIEFKRKTGVKGV